MIEISLPENNLFSLKTRKVFCLMCEHQLGLAALEKVCVSMCLCVCVCVCTSCDGAMGQACAVESGEM